MEAAQNSLERILTCVGQLDYLIKGDTLKEGDLTSEEEATIREADLLREKFEASMDDDFNTADAIAAIFELVKLANINCGEGSTGKFVLSMKDRIVTLCDVLGIVTEKEEEILPDEIERLIEERQEARKNKDYAKADKIRDDLLKKGIILEDTREGVRWKRK